MTVLARPAPDDLALVAGRQHDQPEPRARRRLVDPAGHGVVDLANGSQGHAVDHVLKVAGDQAIAGIQGDLSAEHREAVMAAVVAKLQ